MFLELLSFLASLDTGFNVLSYLTVRAVFAMMTALLITLFLGKWIISKLLQYQIGQVIRDDGPETHLEKKGTPTMGGVLILFAFCTFWKWYLVASFDLKFPCLQYHCF